MIDKMKPYKASRSKHMLHNRGTGRLKTFRVEENRKVRVQMRRALRVYHQSDGERSDYNDFLSGGSHWD